MTNRLVLAISATILNLAPFVCAHAYTTPEKLAYQSTPIFDGARPSTMNPENGLALINSRSVFNKRTEKPEQLNTYRMLNRDIYVRHKASQGAALGAMIGAYSGLGIGLVTALALLGGVPVWAIFAGLFGGALIGAGLGTGIGAAVAHNKPKEFSTTSDP